MVVADAEKSLAAPKAGDLPNLIFGKVQLILNEPCLLLLHLHNQFNAAGIEDSFAVTPALQTEKVLHSL